MGLSSGCLLTRLAPSLRQTLQLAIVSVAERAIADGIDADRTNLRLREMLMDTEGDRERTFFAAIRPCDMVSLRFTDHQFSLALDDDGRHLTNSDSQCLLVSRVRVLCNWDVRISVLMPDMKFVECRAVNDTRVTTPARFNIFKGEGLLRFLVVKVVFS